MAEAPFAGFITGGAAVTLPGQLFVEVLPAIEDAAELRATLYALYAIALRRGALRAVRASQLRAEPPLARWLAPCGGVDALDGALARAAARGTLLACPLEDGDTLYFVNSEGGRRNLLRVRSGALAAPGVGARPAPPAESAEPPARVYEQEIGTLTPAVAEALAEASGRYPEAWIVEALRLAAQRNARSWRYAEAVLRRWEREGRDDATAGGDSRDHDPFAKVARRSWP
ncbi:MAG: DnaD domain protein [Dehalococcoidia bacterium]|nr:DnaD domain protein [Dehalococcoidia bacterium]